MSGGTFDHNEYHISRIATEIEEVIVSNDAPTGAHLSPETIERFAQAVDLLRRAHILVHRIDYLLAGDDGEDNFHERVKKDLAENEKMPRWRK